MVKEEGASSLARGVVPNVFRAVLMNASQLASWVAFRFLFLCCISDTPAPDTTISNQSFWRHPTSRITSTAILRLVLLPERLQRLSALRPMSSRLVSGFLKNYKFLTLWCHIRVVLWTLQGRDQTYVTLCQSLVFHWLVIPVVHLTVYNASYKELPEERGRVVHVQRMGPRVRPVSLFAIILLRHLSFAKHSWTRLQPTTILIFLTLEQLRNLTDYLRGDS